MTNAYAQALATLQQQPDHELKQIGDQWETPPEIAWGLFYTFAPKIGPIVLDIFADDCNALVANYYTAADNALQQDLAGDLRQLSGAAFGNPPYSIPKVDSENNPITGMENILDWCRAQRDQGAKIMLLVKVATSEGWWPEDADFIQFIAGRIGFKAPSWYKPRDPKKDKPASSGFASAVIIWDKDWKLERRPVERLSRDQLFTTGRMLLDMINARAEQIADVRLSAPAETETSVCATKQPETASEQAKNVLNHTEIASDQSNYASEPALPVLNDTWPIEVTELVESALDQCPCEPNDAFYAELCALANALRLSGKSNEEAIQAVVATLKEVAADHLQGDAA
ncbi:phage N-6-adenine-methyltransferase [Rheinheimera sp. 1928-s]|uniref:phage N-6-adenine-methyltransferase n=1 Tax=Rheinheimera sp. 1928-s TaxID=3033803 RepID=UPI00260ADD94|nr:phage N-6-adenine-methyltransferase [Rheinheimera sp. 1928-s]MDF3127432.1 phage N-6-adenine-methyltransferase [Rheinheimera sp. 1928-s]